MMFLKLYHCSNFIATTQLMRPKPLLTGWLLLLSVITIQAQKNRPQLKFGDVKPEDFAPAAYAVDSSAEAFTCSMQAMPLLKPIPTAFSVLFSSAMPVSGCCTKNAFGLATVEIKLYGKDKNAQLLDRLEAATYNLEGGKSA